MSDEFTGADFETAAGDTSTTPADPAVTPTVDTTAQPGADTTVPAVASASPSTDVVPSKPARAPGPIPFPEHEQIIKNARTKEREAVQAEWQQYEWAKQVDRSAIDQAVQIAQRYQQDPGGYLQELMTEAIGNPQLAPIARSIAARILGQRPAAAPQPVDLTPIPVEMTDGQTRNLYTAEQMQAELNARIAELRKEFQPALTTATQLQQANEVAEANRQAGQFAITGLKELSGLPHFKEHAKAISEALVKEPLRSGDPEAVLAAAYRVYNRLVLPNLGTLERRAVLTDQNATATASTVNPSRTGVATPKTWAEMSTSEALAYAASQTG